MIEEDLAAKMDYVASEKVKRCMGRERVAQMVIKVILLQIKILLIRVPR